MEIIQDVCNKKLQEFCETLRLRNALLQIELENVKIQNGELNLRFENVQLLNSIYAAEMDRYRQESDNLKVLVLNLTAQLAERKEENNLLVAANQSMRENDTLNTISGFGEVTFTSKAVEWNVKPTELSVSESSSSSIGIISGNSLTGKCKSNVSVVGNRSNEETSKLRPTDLSKNNLKLEKATNKIKENSKVYWQRLYGVFHCPVCNDKWGSSKSFVNTPQTCRYCETEVYPHNQRPVMSQKKLQASNRQVQVSFHSANN